MLIRFLSFLLLAWLAGFVIFAVTLPRHPKPGITDGVVVLTGGAGRLERGFTLLRQKQARRMLVSGVDRRVRPHELAVEYRVPDALVNCCVDLGQEAVDTRSNADETAEWARARGYRSLRLVTTDWHMPRSHFELRRAAPGLTIIVDPVRSEPGLFALTREYSKYLLRRVVALAGY
ncbi:YdcF family protein [Sphingomonas naphthae]|uniref:YdcF family protein n=1 Tax=Sphingomonas naphthae TaxID=1813468 RepID=A0ABY7TKT3_9SPHN|nr:YdcF family protein [Sphingomonas naphthae]WCT73847.1 YdcF family protein [Sphingomonas naphthae]